MDTDRIPTSPDGRIAWLGIALAALIFTADCLIPVGVAVGTLYAIPVLLGLWVPGRSYTWTMAGAGLALTWLGYYLSPAAPVGTPVDFWQVLANRWLSIAGIGMTAFIVLHDRRSQASLQREIHERHVAEHRLIEQKALAQLGEMAAVVAHEVKNPLAGIAGAVQIIGERLPAESRERQVAGDILKRIGSLNRTVEDLLLFARPRPPDRRPVDLARLLRETAGLVNRDSSYPELVIEVTGRSLTGNVDPDLFREVFLNLLLNAAQAMQGRGRIRVDVTADAAGCQVLVADEGPGIPAEIRARIFEPFFSTRSRGTGLGLNIARRVVEMHDGTIAVDCPAGGGTTVQITLPRELLLEPESRE